MSTKFFIWVKECCELLNWNPSKGEDMMPSKDPSWYFCFDDGMTPEEAVREYKSKINGKSL